MSTLCRRRSDSWSIQFIAYVVIMTVAYVFYMRFAPVISDFKIQTMQHTPYGLEVSGTLNKTRNCILESLAVTTPINDINKRLWVDFSDLKDAPVGTLPNRPTGKQYWGPWTVFLTGSETKISMIALHRCEWGILIPTRLVTDLSIHTEETP